MTESSSGRPVDGRDVPSMLDLVRLSPRDLFPPGGRDLYRQVALLTGVAPGQEVLVAACGSGVTAEFFAREFGAQVVGVDEDPALVEQGESRVRKDGVQGLLHFQQGPMDSLPYRDHVFDVAIGELGLSARADPTEAIRELVRVVRPGGRVALIQPVWKAPVDQDRRDLLSRHLGAHPLMLVEVKRALREAGVRQLHTEAWSDRETAFRREARKPFPDFAEIFTVPEKVGILRRAWRRWGWRGVRAALAREREVHRLITRERILGLDMVTGRKTEEPPPDQNDAPSADAAQSPPSADAAQSPPSADAAQSAPSADAAPSAHQTIPAEES
jgi:ubiquinone/menaquinone biosynthesis C-methylase UbiE